MILIKMMIMISEEKYLQLIAKEDEALIFSKSKDNETLKTTDSMKVDAEINVKKAIKNLEKLSVAPGEHGKFQNWGQDIFLEEKCFPEKFPYGIGGYLSSCLQDENNRLGFSEYSIGRLMSGNPKFRLDPIYIFFILLVKELIQVKRCKSTYFRQATRLSNLKKNDIIDIDRTSLSRYNRTYQVFKSMRGTTCYFEEAKKNLNAILRQKGCPTLFLTVSCAEFDWPELLKEILEATMRKNVTDEYIENLTATEKNNIISQNVVISTIHFQKRIDKLFTIMQKNFFNNRKGAYHVASYYYRVEFQQRGAPHVHSLIWLKDQDGIDAPSFWKIKDGEKITEQDEERRIENVEKLADSLISTNPLDIRC